MHPGVPIAPPPPALGRRCAGHCDGMLVPANPGHSSPAPSRLKGSGAMRLLLSARGVQARALQERPPILSAGPAEALPRMTSWEYYGDGETSWALVPGWNRTQAAWKTGRAKSRRTMEGAQAKGEGGGVGVAESKRKEKPHATQEDSREGGRRWWRKDLQETSAQTWHCQSSWILFGIRLCERKRGNI